VPENAAPVIVAPVFMINAEFSLLELILNDRQQKIGFKLHQRGHTIAFELLTTKKDEEFMKAAISNERA